eukprot:363965-Chlamydomonas_euryale.AAC.1
MPRHVKGHPPPLHTCSSPSPPLLSHAASNPSPPPHTQRASLHAHSLILRQLRRPRSRRPRSVRWSRRAPAARGRQPLAARRAARQTQSCPWTATRQTAVDGMHVHAARMCMRHARWVRRYGGTSEKDNTAAATHYAAPRVPRHMYSAPLRPAVPPDMSKVPA